MPAGAPRRRDRYAFPPSCGWLEAVSWLPSRESTRGAGSQPCQTSSRGAEQAAPRDRRPLVRLGGVPCALRLQQADRERPELMSCVS